MHIPSPSELKQKREQLKLKQVDVARLAGLSQSMVARIESGTVDPRVSTLKKVVEVLAEAERSTVVARDVMCSPVYSVQASDPIAKVVEIMEEQGISQLPVLEHGVPMGCISETAIISAIGEKKQSRDPHLRVREYMESGFPTIPPDADLEMVIHILQNHHAVLVVERGEIQGVITKHDLISLLS